MILKDQVFAQAVLLAGEMDVEKMDLLSILCSVSTASLAARLREGLSPEDCREEFVAAASLYALAAMNSVNEETKLQEFKAGDLTIKEGGGAAKDAASRCLEKQAEMVIGPYLKDRFLFAGV